MNSSLLIIGADTLLGKHVVRNATRSAGEASVFAYARAELPLDDLPNLIADLQSSRPDHIVLVHEMDDLPDPMSECADRANDQIVALLNLFAAAAHLGCRRISFAASHVGVGWQQMTPLGADSFLRSTLASDALPATLVPRLLLSMSRYYERQYSLSSFFYLYPHVFGDFPSTKPAASERLNRTVDAVLRARSNGEGQVTLSEPEGFKVDFAYAEDVARALLMHAESGRAGVAVHAGVRRLPFGDIARAIVQAARYTGTLAYSSAAPVREPILIVTDSDLYGEPPTDPEAALRTALVNRAEMFGH